MNTKYWQPQLPFQAILFDCDSTLSQIEGINELAKMHHVYEAVYQLTEIAMTKTGINLDFYNKRLELVKPTAHELIEIADIYWNERTTDVKEVIHILQSLGKTVYVVSAGIQQSVELFAEMLGIPAGQVFAVPVYFDERGNYKSFQLDAPLANTNGKALIAKTLHQKHNKLALIGDGMNDLEAAHDVDLFIGYGGKSFRQIIADGSQFYLNCTTMAPTLPLLLTQDEVDNLELKAKEYYAKGLEFIGTDQVLMNFTPPTSTNIKENKNDR